MGAWAPPPSAADPSAGETNPRRDEMRSLGLRGGPWRYVLVAAGIVVATVGILWFVGRPAAPTMPALTGMSFEDALGAISGTNELCLDVVRMSDGGEPGDVLDQQPLPGKDLSRGAGQWAVALSLGAGLDPADIKVVARAAPAGTICGGDRSGLFETAGAT